MENTDDLNDSGLDTSKTVCTTGKELGTALDDQSVPSSWTEKHCPCSGDVPADSSVEQIEQTKENTCSLEVEMSCVHNSAEPERSENITQQQNAGGGTCETIVDSHGQQDDVHVSGSIVDSHGQQDGVHVSGSIVDSHGQQDGVHVSGSIVDSHGQQDDVHVSGSIVDSHGQQDGVHVSGSIVDSHGQQDGVHVSGSIVDSHGQQDGVHVSGSIVDSHGQQDGVHVSGSIVDSHGQQDGVHVSGSIVDSYGQQDGVHVSGSIVDSHGQQDGVHVSGSQQGTYVCFDQEQSFQLDKTETESEFSTTDLSDISSQHILSSAFTGRDGKTPDSSETICNFVGEIPVRNTPELDTVNDHDHSCAPDKENSNELEQGESRAHLTSGQRNAESRSQAEASLDSCCQRDLSTVDSADNQTDDKPQTVCHQDSNTGWKRSVSKQSETETGSLGGVAGVEQGPGKETGTGYLDSVISSIQALTSNQAEADKDTVHISRAELTLMVQQMLAAQTMCNYVQNLVQKNKTLNKQNEVLKDTIVQTRKWDGKVQEGENLSSLSSVSQATDAHVFRFPGLPPGHEGVSSQIQTDCDFISDSVQLSSQISFDGDNSINREVSAAGKSSLGSSNYAASGASVPAQGASQLNIPHDIVLTGARWYSLGPQQNEESGAGRAWISQEQFARVLEELERCKRFVNKISKDAGIHPDDIKELLNLRGKVQSLQEENSQLKIELQNRPASNCVWHVPDQEQGQQSIIKSLQEKIQNQKKREDDLLKLIAQIGPQNKKLKSGASKPLSQPPSSVGLEALPPIVSTATASCQTEKSYPDVEEYAGLLASMSEELKLGKQEQYLLRNEHERLNEMLKQAQRMEEKCTKDVQTLRSQLLMKNDENHKLQQSQHNLHQKAQDLMDQMEEQKRKLSQEMERQRHLETEAERYRRKLDQELDRNKQLEKIIDDERKRCARDERELLKQVKILTEMSRQVAPLRRLVLAVDRARQACSPLSPDCENQLAALWRQDQGNTPVAMTPPSNRTLSSQGGMTGSPNARFPQSQNAAGAGLAGAVPHRGGGQQGSVHGGPGYHSAAASNAAPPAAASPAPLPPVLARQLGPQHPGPAVPQAEGHEPLQRSRQGSNASSAGSSGSALNSHYRY